MTVDLRRFQYQLEPVRSRARWELETLQARLGIAQRELEAAQAKLSELRARHASEARAAAEAFAGRRDPRAHASVLQWLAHLRDRIRDGERAVAELEARRAAAAEACRVQQRKVDALERHREDSLAAFAAEEEGRAAAEADREWLVRVGWARELLDGASEGGTP